MQVLLPLLLCHILQLQQPAGFAACRRVVAAAWCCIAHVFLNHWWLAAVGPLARVHAVIRSFEDHLDAILSLQKEDSESQQQQQSASNAKTLGV
jgi:hypothetical protein